jgi:hypothetical protein
MCPRAIPSYASSFIAHQVSLVSASRRVRQGINIRARRKKQQIEKLVRRPKIRCYRRCDTPSAVGHSPSFHLVWDIWCKRAENHQGRRFIQDTRGEINSPCSMVCRITQSRNRGTSAGLFSSATPHTLLAPWVPLKLHQKIFMSDSIFISAPWPRRKPSL